MNIVCIKTMRGDHMIMLAVLSAASILMLYYGSLMTPTEVYLPITPSTLRHSHPEPKVTTTAVPVSNKWVYNLQKHARRVYSQWGEDGLLEEIFKNIGTTDKFYVEFGTETGVQCNTRYLRTRGWTGLMMDGSNENQNINLQKEYISPYNIVDLFKKYKVPKKFDLLSIDINSYDAWVWAVLNEFDYKPRVVIIERKDFGDFVMPPVQVHKFGWDRKNQRPYELCDDKFCGTGSDALIKLGEKYNYRVVGHTYSNLIFIHDFKTDLKFKDDSRPQYKLPRYRATNHMKFEDMVIDISDGIKLCKKSCSNHKYTPFPVRKLKAPDKVGKVDVVYLWVNGTINQPKDTTGLREVSTANRFREWNELKYSVELLKENGKNLGNIYVVTNGNRPQYDNMNDIIFIDHSGFIPKKYLPTFSSYTIQFNLDGLFHKVSDPFILLDDDFFITKKTDLLHYTKQNAWFVEAWGHDWGTGPSTDHFVQAVKNSNKILKKVYKNFKQFGVIAHMPLTIRHKHFRKMKELIDTTVSMTPYRSKTSLQFQYTLAAVGKYSFNSKLRPARGFYHFIMMNNIDSLKKSFNSIIKNKRDFLTLNDDIKTVTDHKNVIDTFLRGLTLKSNELKRYDLDNTISSRKGGSSIIFFNLLRGKEWKKACQIIKGYDPYIVFLNEMDWGMARSNNEHTTQLLAQCLSMNYLFGVEFIELTKGNKGEQSRTRGMSNTWSWHGNAILSKSPLSDASVVRLPGTEAFWSKGLRGAEQRKGGRMAIAAMVDGVRVICTHLDYFVGQSYNKKSLRTLGAMFKEKHIILAGDLGTPGRQSDTPNALNAYGFDRAFVINSVDSKASGDWIMTKNVVLGKSTVVPSGSISDHNIIISKKNFFFLDNCGSYACNYYKKDKNLDAFGVLDHYGMKIVHGPFVDEIMDLKEANTDFTSFNYISAFNNKNDIFITTPVSLGSQCGLFKVSGNKIKDYIRGRSSGTLKRKYPAWTTGHTKNTIRKMSSNAKDYSVLPLWSFEECSMNKQGNEILVRTREGKHVVVNDFVPDPKGYTFYNSTSMTGPFTKLDIKFKDTLHNLHYAADTAVTMYRDINGLLRTTVRKEIPYHTGSSRGWRGIAFLYQCGNYWCEESELHLAKEKNRRKGPQIYANRVSKIGDMYYLVMGIFYAHGKSYNNKKVEAEIVIVPSNDGIYFDVRYAYTFIEESPIFKDLYSMPTPSNLVQEGNKLVYFHVATYNTHGDGKNLNAGILRRPLVIKRSVEKDKLFGLRPAGKSGQVLMPSGNLTIVTNCDIQKNIYYETPTILNIVDCIIYKVYKEK